MATTRIDPLRNFRFRLEIDGIAQAGFSEVLIADTTVEAVDYRLGTDPPHMRKLSGLTKYGTITLKWGMTTGANALDLYKWHADVSAGHVKDKRKTVAIIALDEAGEDAARFVVSNAWPVKYDPADYNAKSNEVAIELMELTHEGYERVQ
jgi:phage tail-like protein